MARRSRRAGDGADASPAPTSKAATTSLNAPFRELRKHLAQRPAPAPVPPPALEKAAQPPAPSVAAPAAPPPPDEAALFAHAMSGVRPLPATSRERIDRPPPTADPPTPISEEAEALAALSDLVTGTTRFDVTDTREYVEGAVVGLDPRLVRRLRRGDFAWQAHLDLHGHTAAEARVAVEKFVLQAFRDARRCVLIVHGRGHNSKDHTPVLKEGLKTWLARGALGKVVLAFATARPNDGGAGALYVLLRRDRRAAPIRVTEGAKR
jgi:DNA-nicking Smr family endonuclease